MKYALSIDWLQFFCVCGRGRFLASDPYNETLDSPLPYGYRLEKCGSRHYKKIVTIIYDGEDIAQVQHEPHSTQVLPPDSCIIKFDNRLLYSNDLWNIVEYVLKDHHLRVRSLSRVDICADFNSLHKYDCVQFITDFLASKIRHKGSGKGAAHFEHYGKMEHGYSISHLDYTGLTFGSHDSDSRAYLYNKTRELAQAKDKPYIRDFWNKAGLDTTKDVWRLEISLKSKAMKFKNKQTADVVKIDKDELKDTAELAKLFHTFRRKLFSFIVNRPGITNISREPLIELFNGEPYYEHGVLRNVTGSTRTERILIKQLWQMVNVYRGTGFVSDNEITKTLATNLAETCDLQDWLTFKKRRWDKPTKK